MKMVIKPTVVEDEDLHPELTWDEAAEISISGIFDNSSTISRGIFLSDLRTQLDLMIGFINNKGISFISDEEWIASWKALGSLAVNAGIGSGSLTNDPEKNTKDFTAVMIRKQLDYGSENILRFGRIGLLVRLHDKIARLINLEKRKTDPQNESLRDNYMDVINYCAIGVMVENEWFTLPLAGDKNE